MARVATIGFESNDVTIEQVNLTFGTVAATIQSTVARSGIYAAACASGAGNGTSYVSSNALPSENGVRSYLRFYFRVNVLPASTVRLAIPYAANTSWSTRLTSGGKLQLWNDVAGTQIGADSTATIVANTWYRVEMMIFLNISGQPDEFELLLDGVLVANYAAADLTGSSGFWQLGWLDAPGANRTLYLDDIALNNTTGSNQTSYPGDGKVVLLKPISDNARATLWTAGGGGLTNLWDAVNNTPPVGIASGNNTSQIEHAGGAAGTTDSYDANLTTYTAAGVGAADTVKLTEYVIVHGEDVATGTKLLNMQLVSNPTDTISANFTAGNDAGQASTYPTLWAVRRNGIVYNPSVIKGTSPVARVRRPETATRVASVCFMGVFVEYQPPQGTPATLSATVATATAQAEASTIKAIATFGATVADTTASAQAAKCTTAAMFPAALTTAVAAAESALFSGAVTFAATLTTATTDAGASSVAGAVAATFAASVATATSAAFSQYIGKITIFAASTAGATAQARGLLINYAINPSVEVTLTAWAGATGTLSRDSADHFAGNWAGKVVATGITNVGALHGYTPVGLLLGDDLWVGGERFSASAWIKAPAAGLPLAISLGYRTAANAQIGIVTINPISTGAWQYVKIEGGTIPPLTHHIYLHCYVASGIAVNDVVWVDAFDFRREVVILGSTFDGSTSGAGWLGTANNAYSAMLSPVETISFVAIANVLATTATATASAGAATFAAGANVKANVAGATAQTHDFLTNYIGNPSAEVDTAGWSLRTTSGSGFTSSLTRDTSKADTGIASFKLTIAGNPTANASVMYRIVLPISPVDAEKQWSFGFRWQNDNAGVSPAISTSYYASNDGTGTNIGFYAPAPIYLLNTAWGTIKAESRTLPANTRSIMVDLRVYVQSAGQTGAVWFDAVGAFPQAAYPANYFDGSLSPAEWTGTAHASPSVLATGPDALLTAASTFAATITTATSNAGSSTFAAAIAATLSATVATATSAALPSAFTFGAKLVAIPAIATSLAPVAALSGAATLSAAITNANASAGTAAFKAVALVTATAATATTLAHAGVLQGASGAGISASSASATASAQAAQIIVSAQLRATTAAATAQAESAALGGQALLSALSGAANAAAGGATVWAAARLVIGASQASAAALTATFNGASAFLTSPATTSAQAEDADFAMSASGVFAATAATASAHALAASITAAASAILLASVALAEATAEATSFRADAVLATTEATAIASAEAANLLIGRVVLGTICAECIVVQQLAAQIVCAQVLTATATVEVIRPLVTLIASVEADTDTAHALTALVEVTHGCH